MSKRPPSPTREEDSPAPKKARRNCFVNYDIAEAADWPLPLDFFIDEILSRLPTRDVVHVGATCKAMFKRWHLGVRSFRAPLGVPSRADTARENGRTQVTATRLARLTRLRVLAYRATQSIKGAAISATVATFRHLTHLSVSNGIITAKFLGLGADGTCALPNLTTLTLEDSVDIESGVVLKHLPALRNLTLVQKTGEEVPILLLHDTPLLRHLTIPLNRWTESALELADVHTLTITGSDCSGRRWRPDSTKRLRSLRILTSCCDVISPLFLAKLAPRLTQLYLSLGDGRTWKYRPEFGDAIASLTALTDLTLIKFPDTFSGDSLAPLTGLRRLALHQCEEVAPSMLTTLVNLSYLLVVKESAGKFFVEFSDYDYAAHHPRLPPVRCRPSKTHRLTPRTVWITE